MNDEFSDAQFNRSLSSRMHTAAEGSGDSNLTLDGVERAHHRHQQRSQRRRKAILVGLIAAVVSSV